MATKLPDRSGTKASLKTEASVTTTAVPKPNKPTPSNQLKVNESLGVGKSLVSRDGRFSFSNQDDGNIVLYDNEKDHRVLWASDTYLQQAGKITVQTDGNVVGASWSTGTGGRGNASTVLILQEDGNVVVLSNSKQIWETGTKQRTKVDEMKPLRAGESLSGDQALSSPNGRFRFVIQEDNNLVLYDKLDDDSVLWASDTDIDEAQPRLTLATDGNLIVYDGNAKKWSSNTAGKGDKSSTLTVQDNGNVVISSKTNVIWSTGTKGRNLETLDRLSAGESLPEERFLKSPNDAYKLIMQEDGNLVLYETKNNNRVVWAADSESFRGRARAELQTNGNFIVYNGDVAEWASKTDGQGDASSVLILQNDGEVIVRSKGVQIWSLGTKQKIENFDRMVAGETLGRNAVLKSPNGRFHLVMQPDGNLVLYDVHENDSVLFATASGAGNPKLSLEKDGNLVVYDNDSPQWSSRTPGKGDESSILQVLDDGNVVLTSRSTEIWSTCTRQRVKTNHMNSGECLRVGEALISNNKQFKLVMLDDGKLVVYDVSNGSHPIWATGSNKGEPPLRAALQVDGNFVVYAGGEAGWASDCWVSNAILTMQDDGNLVLTSNGSQIWSSERKQRSPVNNDGELAGKTLKHDKSFVVPTKKHTMDLQGNTAGNSIVHEYNKAVQPTNTYKATSIVARENNKPGVVGPGLVSEYPSGVAGGNAAPIKQNSGIVRKPEGTLRPKRA